MNKGKPLVVADFNSPDNPLNSLADSQQLRYIKSYLTGAGVVSVIVEPNYFDRDYLDEFSTFYSKSAYGYRNTCDRLHFFKNEVTEAGLQLGLGGEGDPLQEGYLGFLVLRPLVQAPFGRTVLAWYENADEHSERITPVLREYVCNILGLKLTVKGIPWQQQDRGVSACATIALWSMFHSSAFDANHAIPTTVEITQNALGASSGSRAFPSQGLTISELKEAIYAQSLSPKILAATKIADVEGDANTQLASGFSIEYLASMCASNIRSGYPVLLVGEYVHKDRGDQQHAICCMGFREQEQQDKEAGTCSTMDDETRIFYIHDDNIGPNVRCCLEEIEGLAVLRTEEPAYIDGDQAQPQTPIIFRPSMMIIAVHEEIRMGADPLVAQAKAVAQAISKTLNEAYGKAGLELPAISYNAQFLDVRKFYSEYLARVVSNNSALLGKIRTALGRDSQPLCLHIGLVSIGIVGDGPLRIMDIIYDTTDSSINCPVVAHIIYDPMLQKTLGQFPQAEVEQAFGCQILGYDEEPEP